MLLTHANIEALLTSFSGDFRAAYEAAPTFWSQIAMRVPSNSKRNDYGWMAQLPTMREWVGPRVVKSLAAHSYTLPNKKWELTLGIPSDDLEDDNLGVFSTLSADYGQAAAEHVDEEFAKLLEAAHTSAVLCFDGQNFFDTDHPVSPADEDSATYSNYRTGKALSQENFLELRAAMAGFKGDEGRIVGRRPDLLVVPPALEGTAIEILENERNSDGSTNTTRGMAKILVIDQLTDENAWYLLSTKRAIKPFIFQVRRDISLVSKNGKLDENIIVDGEARFYADARYSFGVSLPFLAIKATSQGG